MSLQLDIQGSQLSDINLEQTYQTIGKHLILAVPK